MCRRIYLVEDEKNLNVLLKRYLQIEGYEVTAFIDGNSAMQKIKDIPDLWILDIMLPDINGYELIRVIKENSNDTPVIFISARNEELDRVVGLELGSDDYLPKPFLPRELVIRTNKLLERVYGKESNNDLNIILYVNEYKIDKSQRNVFLKGEKIDLLNKEFDMLVYFTENKNNLLSREQILSKVWGNNYFGTDRVIDDTIRRLRKKMCNLTIETVYGYGYRLAEI